MRIEMELLESLINRDLASKYCVEHNHQELEDTDEGTGVYAVKIVGNIGEEHGWQDAFSQGVDLGVKLASIYPASPLTSHFEETSKAIDSAAECERAVFVGVAKNIAGV